MLRKVEAFFGPCVTLNWHAPVGNGPATWRPEGDRKNLVAVRFIMREAGLDDKNSLRMTADQLDAFGRAAGVHGYSLELVGEPDE